MGFNTNGKLAANQNIAFNSLSLIDSDTEYTFNIDYKNLCTGQIILGTSQSDWLKF
ncbi:MAG: hypothetical protein HUJ68_07645 [Clostridia bacterium]|nr:hypothetical protein [Clostridia bacterium]